jgi:hypothetical protein
MQPQSDHVIAKVGTVVAAREGQSRRKERAPGLDALARAQQVGDRRGELDGGGGGQQGRRRRPRQPDPADHEQRRQAEQRQKAGGVVAELRRHDDRRQTQSSGQREEDLLGVAVGVV